ncbi:MAG: glycosyl transferase, partial [Alphaproteobacteria bacterium]
MTKPKVFFYVQHLLGIGHSMRAALLTRAMTEAGLEVTLVNGGEPTNLDDPGAVRSIQLTPARAAV